MNVSVVAIASTMITGHPVRSHCSTERAREVAEHPGPKGPTCRHSTASARLVQAVLEIAEHIAREVTLECGGKEAERRAVDTGVERRS